MKHLRLLLTAVAVIAGLGLYAQTWTNADLADGKYILKNVATGRYLGPSNSWGTQASLIESSHWNTLAKVADGVYTIESQVSNGGSNYYFTGTFMDGAATNVTIQKHERGFYSLTVDGTNYLGYDGSSNVLAGNITSQDDPNASWEIVSYDEFLKGASKSNPKDATYLIACPNFDRNHRYASAWSMVASNQNLSGGTNENKCAESWQATFTLSQEVTVPNGYYKVRAQAALTDYANLYDGNDYPVVYAGEATTPFNSMDESDRGTNMNTLSASFAAGKYFTEYVEVAVTTGKLTIGVKGTRTDTWCIWDNFQMQYLGPITDLTPFINAYKKALADAKTAAQTTEKIAPSVLTKLNQAITTYEEGKVDETSQSTLEAATAALNEATALANSSIASYKTIASGVVPTDNVAGWTCTNTQAFHVNTWSVEGDSDGTGMKTPFIENWVNNTSVLGDGMVYYTLAGLEPGEIYYASALVRVYSETGNQPNGPIFFVNTTTTDISTAGTTVTHNALKGVYGTFGGVATVGEDGLLTIGVKIENANYNWVAFKNVSIRDMNDALQAAIDKLKALRESVPEAMQKEIDNIDENLAGEFDLTTLAGIEAAIQNLEEMASDYAKAADIYNKYKLLRPYGGALVAVDSDNPRANSNLSNTMKGTDREVNEALSSETINSAYESLYDAMVAYAAEANPTRDNKFDLTFMLVNPNLEGMATWAGADGWYTDQTDGNSQVMTNENATSEDGTKTAFYEYWSEAAKANNEFTLYQKVTLAPGIYNMSCYAFAQQDTGGNVRGVKFYANNTEGSTIQSDRLAPASIEFVQTETGEVKVGLKAVTGNTYRWMGIGYVELYKLSPIKEATLADNDQNAPKAGAYTTINYDRKLIAGLNTLVLPFATTKDELGADLVLEYKGSEQSDGKTVLRFTSVEELSANTPYAILMDNEKSLTSFENKTVAEPTDLTVNDAEYAFVGTYTAYNTNSPILAGDYIAVERNFQKAAGGNVIKAYRAYLKKVGNTVSEVAISINGDFTDGITATTANGNVTAKGMFNLNGQKVKHMQKGVYIVDGKKIVVK